MMETPLTNMEGRWVHSTKEAFDALVAMGYRIHPNIDSFYDLEDELFIEKKYIDSFIGKGAAGRKGLKQAYYHNGHFYDEPYEEFTITEEKVQFPELEDIEWVMVEAPEWMLLTHIGNDMDRIKLGVKITKIPSDLYSYLRKLDENSKDFKVTWKLKEKINRKLHENRPLALAIGKLADVTNKFIKLEGGMHLHHVSVTGQCYIVNEGDTSILLRTEDVVLPDDYIIPDQVLQWMKEYQEQLGG